ERTDGLAAFCEVATLRFSLTCRAGRNNLPNLTSKAGRAVEARRLRTARRFGKGLGYIEGSSVECASIVDTNEPHSGEDASISLVVCVGGSGVAGLSTGIGGAIH